MYLHQYWRDERLSWSPHIDIDDMTLSGEFSQYVRAFRFYHFSGLLVLLLKSQSKHQLTNVGFTSTLACHMDLRNYPLDSQNCTVEIESCKFDVLTVE
uniref:Neurotransmitter-gated ion-channel ligand-binding domain-containing protein n=1 Tax=Parascaris equorum TaxID=6256 RepID=A0A914S262_PAREQ